MHGRTVFEARYFWIVLHFESFLHVRLDINVYLLKCTKMYHFFCIEFVFDVYVQWLNFDLVNVPLYVNAVRNVYS